MLLTLAASSLRKRLSLPKSSEGALDLTDLPRYTRDRLNLFGLNLSTDLLVGADLARLDRVREAADKASCPCLVLIEPAPLGIADPSEAKSTAAAERATRVVQAAHRLGCNAAAVGVNSPDTPAAFATSAERLKRIMQLAERLEVNLLLVALPGLTEDPERLTDLIKKIGGFRIGTFPDFETASKSGDINHYLRRLTPFASALTASSTGFKSTKGGLGFAHEAYDLTACVKTVASVGYTGTLAIDYRGPGDAEEGVDRTRKILEAALAKEAPEPEEGAAGEDEVAEEVEGEEEGDE